MEVVAAVREETRQPVKTEKADNLQASFVLRLLDEIDYGLVLVTAQGTVLHANHLARHELAIGRLLFASPGGVVTGRNSALTEQLMAAIRGAVQGHRRLLYLTHGEQCLPLSVIPVAPAPGAAAGSVLLVMARQRIGDNLALQLFAREHCLTPTEESVLRALCDGREVDEIAVQHGVAESTVRTQVRALRDKTGASGIRQLVQCVLSLPPVVGASCGEGAAVRRSASPGFQFV